METSVDRKLPNDRDSMSVFRKVIGIELFHSSIDDLYLHFQMNFPCNILQTKAPKFMDLGLPAVNILDEFGIQKNPLTGLEGRRMDPFGWFRSMFWARR